MPNKKITLLAGVGFIVAAALLLAALFNAKLASGTNPAPPVVLKAAVPSFERSPDTPIDREFERRLNVKFQWTQYPVSEYLKRIKQQLTSSGEKPDVFVIDKDIMQQLGPQGLLLDLRPYLERMPNLKRWMAKYPQIYASIVTEDGKLYGIDGFNTEGKMPTGYIYREDLFYRNGMLLPKTFDELYESLKRLKEIYPDSTPIVNRWGPDNLMSSFFYAYHTSGGIYFNNDTLSYAFGPVEPNYKRAVELMRKFYAAKLIDPDFAVLSEAQFIDRIVRGQAFVLMGEYFIEMDNWIEQGKKLDGKYHLKAVVPPLTDTGLMALQPVQYANSQGGWVIAVNASSKHIDEIIRMLDAQYSDEIMELTNWGIEGETFVRVNGKRHYVSSLRTRLNPLGTVTPKEAGVDGRSGVWVPLDQEAEYARDWGAEGFEALKLYSKNVQKIGYFSGPSISLTQDEMIEITKVMTPLQKILNEKLIKFVTGELDMEKDWDYFQEELESLGYRKVLQIYRDKYRALPSESKKLFTQIK